ncbi:MAG: gamma-glutamylcyclotransferase [Deltaproteobacteria bacterium]|nr:gamma-glutamylcyclotransferase [Deltaproteobacteria bacterium]
MCDDIMIHVAGPCRRLGSATLNDYICLSVKDEQYPAIVPRQGSATKGVVYESISDRGLLNLDEFEGEMYARKTVVVRLHTGVEITVHTYVCKPVYSQMLLDDEWCFDTFLQRGKADFIAKYVGFSKIG